MEEKDRPAVMTKEQIERELREWSRYELRLEQIPKQYRSLVALAQLWGTVDEGLTLALINRAPEEFLRELNAQVRPYGSALNEWLAAPDGSNADNWREYAAYSSLRLVADMAVGELQNRAKRSNS